MKLIDALSEAAEAGLSYGAWGSPIHARSWLDVKGRIIETLMSKHGFEVSAFGCDLEAKGNPCCKQWCGGEVCPKTIVGPPVAPAQEPYKCPFCGTNSEWHQRNCINWRCDPETGEPLPSPIFSPTQNVAVWVDPLTRQFAGIANGIGQHSYVKRDGYELPLYFCPRDVSTQEPDGWIVCYQGGCASPFAVFSKYDLEKHERADAAVTPFYYQSSGDENNHG